MTIIICPACNSDLTEAGKHHDVECLKCGNEFGIADAGIKEIGMMELLERLKAIREVEICQIISRN